MSKNPRPQPARVRPDPDQVTFEKLPEKTKELMKLKEREGKTTGVEQTVVTEKIQDKN